MDPLVSFCLKSLIMLVVILILIVAFVFLIFLTYLREKFSELEDRVRKLELEPVIKKKFKGKEF